MNCDIYDNVEDISATSNDQEIDPFRILIFDSNFEKILDYRSSTFHGRDLDFVSFLKISDRVSNSDDEPADFLNIKIVFSMSIEKQVVDIASCYDMFLVSVSLIDSPSNSAKTNSLNAICAMYAIAQTGRPFDLSKIIFCDKLLTIVDTVFSQLVSPKFSEYVAFVSPYGEVFCTFGKTSLAGDDYYEVWDEALDIASELENSNNNIMSYSTDFLAVFSFLPCVKVAVIFNEAALNFTLPENPEGKMQANNKHLVQPFLKNMVTVKSAIPFIYAKEQE